jgi:hypothetical protein
VREIEFTSSQGLQQRGHRALFQLCFAISAFDDPGGNESRGAPRPAAKLRHVGLAIVAKMFQNALAVRAELDQSALVALGILRATSLLGMLEQKDVRFVMTAGRD